jgi:hypothetical protein
MNATNEREGDLMKNQSEKKTIVVQRVRGGIPVQSGVKGGRLKRA